MDCLFVGVEFFNFTDKKTGELSSAFNLYLAEPGHNVHGFALSKVSIFKGSPLYDEVAVIFNSPQKFPCMAECGFNSRGQLVSFKVK